MFKYCKGHAYSAHDIYAIDLADISKAGVLESADEVDSKSIPSNGVRVQVPPPAPGKATSFNLSLLFRSG